MPWMFLDRNGTFRCKGCSESYLPGLPAPDEIYLAALRAFKRLHWKCGPQDKLPLEPEEETNQESGLEIRNVSIEQKKFEILMSSKKRGMMDVLGIFIESLGDMLDANKADNYLSMTYRHPTKGDLELMIQRKDGKTPAEINSELRAALALALSTAVHGSNCTPNKCTCQLEPAIRARGAVEFATLIENARQQGNLDFLKKLCLEAQGADVSIMAWLIEKLKQMESNT